MADTTEWYLIRKGAYYYRPNECGYTPSQDQAGRYTLEDAIRITHPNGPDGPRDDMDYLPAPAQPEPPAMSSEEKLMPCPCHFCGSTATSAAFFRASDDYQGWQVECSSCGGSGPMNMNTEVEAIAAWNTLVSPAREEVSGEEAEHERQTYLQEVADGAYGDNPMVRGAARDQLAAMNPKPAEADREAKAIIDELNACYLYGVSEKSDALAKRIIAHLSRGAEAASDPCKFTDWRMRQLASAMPKEASTPATEKAVEPVAWLYEKDQPNLGYRRIVLDKRDEYAGGKGWTETPLYPPAANVAGLREALLRQATPEWSYHEDNDRAPRDFWHVRHNLGELSTDWMKWGNQEQRELSPEEKVVGEAASLDYLRRSLTALPEGGA